MRGRTSTKLWWCSNNIIEIQRKITHSRLTTCGVDQFWTMSATVCCFRKYFLSIIADINKQSFNRTHLNHRWIRKFSDFFLTFLSHIESDLVLFTIKVATNQSNFNFCFAHDKLSQEKFVLRVTEIKLFACDFRLNEQNTATIKMKCPSFYKVFLSISLKI